MEKAAYIFPCYVEIDKFAMFLGLGVARYGQFICPFPLSLPSQSFDYQSDSVCCVMFVIKRSLRNTSDHSVCRMMIDTMKVVCSGTAFFLKFSMIKLCVSRTD